MGFKEKLKYLHRYLLYRTAFNGEHQSLIISKTSGPASIVEWSNTDCLLSVTTAWVQIQTGSCEKGTSNFGIGGSLKF